MRLEHDIYGDSAVSRHHLRVSDMEWRRFHKRYMPPARCSRSSAMVTKLKPRRSESRRVPGVANTGTEQARHHVHLPQTGQAIWLETATEQWTQRQPAVLTVNSTFGKLVCWVGTTTVKRHRRGITATSGSIHRHPPGLAHRYRLRQ